MTVVQIILATGVYKYEDLSCHRHLLFCAMFFKPREWARPVCGPSLGASIFCFIETSPTQAGRPYANRVHGGSERRNATLRRRDDTRGEEGPRDDPFNRVSDIARRNKGGFYGAAFFFLFGPDGDYAHASSERTNGRTNDNDVTAWNCVGDAGFAACIGAIEERRVKGGVGFVGWRMNNCLTWLPAFSAVVDLNNLRNRFVLSLSK